MRQAGRGFRGGKEAGERGQGEEGVGVHEVEGCEGEVEGVREVVGCDGWGDVGARGANVGVSSREGVREHEEGR